MKKLFAVFAVTMLFASAAYSFDTSAFQWGLWAPKAQIVPDNMDVSGLKINIHYGSNENVTGLDLGLVSINNNTSALQINALVNSSHESFKGLQVGLFNFSGASNGITIGLLNSTENISGGVTIGLVNTALEERGVQIGLVNYTEFLVGLQIGLVNIATKSTVPFFPIINFCF